MKSFAYLLTHFLDEAFYTRLQSLVSQSVKSKSFATTNKHTVRRNLILWVFLQYRQKQFDFYLSHLNVLIHILKEGTTRYVLDCFLDLKVDNVLRITHIVHCLCNFTIVTQETSVSFYLLYDLRRAIFLRSCFLTKNNLQFTATF